MITLKCTVSKSNRLDVTAEGAGTLSFALVTRNDAGYESVILNLAQAMFLHNKLDDFITANKGSLKPNIISGTAI